MRMIIIGGGQTGKSLARLLLERRHEVSLIEKSHARCTLLANELNAAVYPGDGTNVAVLESAGARKAGCVMAVTGVDQDNLVAAQLAQGHFGAKKVIARVNDPRNAETFRALGIRNVVSSTDLVVQLIEQEADSAHTHLIASLEEGKGEISSMTLPYDTAWEGIALKNVAFPKGTLVIALIREGELTIPNGSTVLHTGDELVAVAEERSRKGLRKTLTATK
ncbi:potassium channel family protein [Acutalibacter caecimuris]|uniref:potassium channel family protein n=1 Tax=Acutalibacter caecimuris TaxID=3093657 RepID=UPI002AC8AF7D|nr:TrkA family potassium uptake protein [Acutalibacter sp. M00118]